MKYDVYCRLKGTNLIKLNLTACSNSKISIYVPIEISKNVDEFNSSSGYYNDICYTTTSDDGTDILLKDRQKKYIDEDKVACQEYCDFSDKKKDVNDGDEGVDKSTSTNSTSSTNTNTSNNTSSNDTSNTSNSANTTNTSNTANTANNTFSQPFIILSFYLYLIIT